MKTFDFVDITPKSDSDQPQLARKTEQVFLFGRVDRVVGMVSLQKEQVNTKLTRCSH